MGKTPQETTYTLTHIHLAMDEPDLVTKGTPIVVTTKHAILIIK